MSESNPDRGSVALVTGAGGGIGAAVAAALVAIGCRVVCAGRRLDRLEATARRLGPSEWQSIVETNVVGLVRVTHKVIAGMVARDRGHITNLGSIAGTRGYAGGTLYAGSKFAVHGFSESLRLDFRNTGIRVTEILPGMVQTDFAFHRWRGDEERAKKFYQEFGVCLAPEDVARMVAFAVQQPPHVVIAQLMVVPISQT
jgi:NADP-dependent 3-hydroxy acid dehydrogenase YdfG